MVGSEGKEGEDTGVSPISIVTNVPFSFLFANSSSLSLRFF